MRMKAKAVVVCICVLGLLAGCASPKPASAPETGEGTAAAPSSELAASQEETAEGGLESYVDPEPLPVESVPEEQPKAEEAAVVAVSSGQAPQMAAKEGNGALQVSDEVYRDIVVRTLQTATALQTGEPIFDGIEDLLTRSPDYVLDIQGMQMNLERKTRFLENVKAGKADDILVILLSDNEDAPVMVETFHFSGNGSKYQVEQIRAENGKVVRETEERSAA